MGQAHRKGACCISEHKDWMPIKRRSRQGGRGTWALRPGSRRRACVCVSSPCLAESPVFQEWLRYGHCYTQTALPATAAPSPRHPGSQSWPGWTLCLSSCKRDHEEGPPVSCAVASGHPTQHRPQTGGRFPLQS